MDEKPQKFHIILQLTLAVGIPYFIHKFFIKSFDPSKAAALAEGPKAYIPAAWRSSTRPATRGTSGPTTTSPTFHFRQKDITSALFVVSKSGMQVASPEAEIPALPGAQNTASHVGDLCKP
jgi:hypothetical protein